jgi:transcriptional regulator with XRE-family HTH domain
VLSARCHLTQEEVAERVGFSPHYFSMLERGVRLPASTNESMFADALALQFAEHAVLDAAAERALISQSEMSSRLVQPVPLVGREQDAAKVSDLRPSSFVP